MLKAKILMAIFFMFSASSVFAENYNCQYDFVGYSWTTMPSACLHSDTIGDVYCWSTGAVKLTVMQNINTLLGGVVSYWNGSAIRFLTTQDSVLDGFTLSGITAQGSCEELSSTGSITQEDYMEYEAWYLTLLFIVMIFYTVNTILYAFKKI